MKYLLILIFLVNCAGIDRKERIQSLPIPSYGCSKYKGKDWEKCLTTLLSRFESIVNTPPTKSEISSERFDSEYRIVVYQYCFGDKDLCFQESEYVYDPTILGKIIFYSKPLGLGLFMGFALGIYAP